SVPWQVLAGAAEREVTVDVVMNRIPDHPGVAEKLEHDLREMLGREGIEISRLFLVAETSLDAESMLPAPAVAELTAHLAALAAAGTGLSRSAAAIAEHTRAQQEEGKRLAEEVDLAFSGARTRIGEAIGDGSLLRGEVLARWQDVVGTGEFFRSVENVFSRVRDRLGHALTGRPAPSIAAEQALGTGLVHVVIDETARGAERAEAAWRATSAGRHLAAG